MKTLALATAMAIFAASAALATDGPPTSAGDHNGRSGAHATAARATDGAPGGPTDGTSRSGARAASTIGTPDSHRQSGDQKVGESGDGGGVTPDGSKPGIGSGSN